MAMKFADPDKFACKCCIPVAPFLLKFHLPHVSIAPLPSMYINRIVCSNGTGAQNIFLVNPMGTCHTCLTYNSTPLCALKYTHILYAAGGAGSARNLPGRSDGWVSVIHASHTRAHLFVHLFAHTSCMLQVVLEAPDIFLDNRMAGHLTHMPLLQQLRISWVHIRDDRGESTEFMPPPN